MVTRTSDKPSGQSTSNFLPLQRNAPNMLAGWVFNDEDAVGGGSSQVITNVTAANPAVITIVGHGYTNGEVKFIDGTGVAAIDGKNHTIANVTTDTFEIAVDGTGWSSGGTSETGAYADITGNGNSLILRGTSAVEYTDVTHGNCLRSDGTNGAGFNPSASFDNVVNHAVVMLVKIENNLTGINEDLWKWENPSGRQSSQYTWLSSENTLFLVESDADADSTDAILNAIENDAGKWMTLCGTLEGGVEKAQLIIKDTENTVSRRTAVTVPQSASNNDDFIIGATFHGLIEGIFVFNTNFATDLEVENIHTNPYKELGVIAPLATGSVSTTLGAVETYVTEGMTNPISATYSGIACSVDNTSFPNVNVTFPDFDDLTLTDLELGSTNVLRFTDGVDFYDLNVTIAKDSAHFQTTYQNSAPPGSPLYNDLNVEFGDVILYRDNQGSITGVNDDSSVNFNSGTYDYDYQVFDVSLNQWSNITNNASSGTPAPGVTGPAATTLGQTETYALVGMNNPVTAIYNGNPVVVDNTNFPNVNVTFPSFNGLPGLDTQLDVSQVLRFDDTTNTADINVTLAKDPANFQTTYAPPAAAGSIGEDVPSAVAGDIFLIRDNDGNITAFGTDTEVTYTGTDYNYDYIWFDVSLSNWSSITNESFTATPDEGETIMTVSTAVDNSAVGRIVGIGTSFKDLRGGGALFLPQRIAVVGQGNTASTFETTKRQVNSALEVAQLYGFGSPLHLAVKQLLPLNGNGVGTIPVTVYPLQDDASGVAATGTITPAGTITEATAYRVAVNNILSEEFVVSVGDTVANIVTAATAAINAVLDMPVTATDNTTNVGLTSKWEGVSANDIFVEIIGSQSVGVTYAVVQPSGGLVNPDVDTALNQIGNVWETLVLNCLNIADTTTLDKYQTFGAGRWGALVRKPLVVFTGNTETTVTAATAVSDARKTDYVNAQLVAPASNDLPCVVAAAQLARIAIVSNNNPPQDYGSQQAVGLTPGDDGDQWLYAARDSAVKKGSSTIEVKDGVVNISDVVTFYHPDGDPIPAYRYVVDIVKLQNIIYNIDLEFTKVEWSGAPLIPDDQPTVNRSAKKPKTAIAAAASIVDGLGLNAIISNTESAKENIQAGINDQNPKRLDLVITVQLSGNSNIISIDLNFGFFFGT